MRAYLNGEIAKQFPDDLLKAIEPISIEQRMPDMTYAKSRDKLFLLSEEQVFGKSRLNSIPEKGVSQLRIFEGSQEYGKPFWWWLRSPYSGNTGSFVSVYSSGAVDFNFAPSSGGVVPGFCLIEPKKI